MNAQTTEHQISQEWKNYYDQGGLRLIAICSCGKRVADTNHKRTATILIKRHLEDPKNR